ncbi:MAG: ABC transporter ATP-binding protein [Propionibacteriaceae bacterium]|jgi:thiamine transport system ATP-binding protein|nr:ABC transporter ATP-binding protein [Propionibacteriaceae bacterium]
MMGSGLEVRNAVVYYERTKLAVDGVSLDVARGEVVAVLGASGSGKSTLLRAVAGLEPLANGRIVFDGVDLADVEVSKRGFVVMFQEGQLFPHLSVARNVAYGIRDLPRAEREQRVNELLHTVELDGYANRAISTLSGGEAQRVALARSLAPNPRLLLLDEPFSALDRALREHLLQVVSQALRLTRTTALLVTHDQDEAFALADRIAVLADGSIQQIATPDHLWRHPASREVAEFLGYGPFLEKPEAKALGIEIADGEVLGIGPRGLEAVEAHGQLLPSPQCFGFYVVVGETRHARGYIDAVVTLPHGQQARVRTKNEPDLRLGVRLVPEECVRVSAGA